MSNPSKLRLKSYLDLFLAPRGLQGLELIAEFCEVTVPTVQTWVREGITPRGEQMLRLRVLLSLGGIKVVEIDHLPPPARELAKMVAFNIITLDEVSVELDYTDKHGVYHVLSGGSLAKSRQRSMEKLVAEAQSLIDEEEEKWRRRISDPHHQAPTRLQGTESEPGLGTEVTAVTPTPDSVSGSSGDIEAPTSATVVMSMSRLLEALLPLVIELDNSSQPESLRSLVANEVGSKRIKRLISSLEEILE